MSEKKQNIFTKILEAGEVALDSYIFQKKNDVISKGPSNQSDADDILFSKAVKGDPNSPMGNQGYYEKSARLGDEFLKSLSFKDSIVASVIQTRQNQVANHSKPVKNKFERGFMIGLKNYDQILEDIMEELKTGKKDNKSNDDEQRSSDNAKIASEISEQAETDVDADDDLNGDMMIDERELRRIAKQELDKRFRKKIQAVTEFITTCGDIKQRQFMDKKWTFEPFLKAIVRDSLTYDRYCVERVRTEADKLAYFVPVDGGTVKYASPALKNYKEMPSSFNFDLLYPELEVKKIEEKTDMVKLDPEKLEADEYRYVQVVRGKIERAFTEEELVIGMRNPTADIYANGYSISELEILASIVASHIFTEHYNKAYFQQGFSAKGILHIKAPINRRKLETLRIQWKHMLSGNKNSFQTPIMAGMDEVQWIPLTQNHSDMEFSNWMNYLIKIICSIYQIDPSEIGFGMKDDAGRGNGGMSGDNTKEKMSQSKDKGLAPLLRNIENLINISIIDELDPDLKFEFVGIKEESSEEALDRQQKEIKYKKTVNEIREEDNLPPIKGCDDLILDPTFFQWFSLFHPDGKLQQQQVQQQQAQTMGQEPTEEDTTMDSLKSPNEKLMDQGIDDLQKEDEKPNPNFGEAPGFQKSQTVKIEYYKIPKGE